jgi:hypothetical protein
MLLSLLCIDQKQVNNNTSTSTTYDDTN